MFFEENLFRFTRSREECIGNNISTTEALQEIKKEKIDAYYLIETFGERIREKCADHNTDNLLEYFEKNIEYIQYLRTEIEECFILLLLTANEPLAIKFIEMGLDITGPFFSNAALRTVQGTVNYGDVCQNMMAYVLEQGANPNTMD